MTDSFMGDDAQSSDISDGENHQDGMFDLNFVDDYSLPQRPQPAAQQGYDSGFVMIDPNLEPVTENSLHELLETMRASQQAGDSYNAFNSYTDSVGGIIAENMNNYPTAMANPQEVAPSYATPVDLQLNGLAQPQHELSVTAFDAPGANTADFQWVPEQQTTTMNIVPEAQSNNQQPWVEFQNPPGQLAANNLGLPQVSGQIQVPLDPNLLHNSAQQQQNLSFLDQNTNNNNNNNNNNITLPTSAHLGSTSSNQDQPLVQHPLFSSSELGPSPSNWLFRSRPHLATKKIRKSLKNQAIMSSSGSDSSSSPSSPEPPAGPLVRAMDSSLVLDDNNEQPLASSSGNPTTAAGNGNHGSSASSSGQGSSNQDKGKAPAMQVLSASAFASGANRPANTVATNENPASLGILRYQSTFNTYFVQDANGGIDTNCHVQRFVPLRKRNNPVPILFLHGDHHTGQHWQFVPGQGKLSWVDHFLQQGFTCYVPDMPMSGRSMGALISREDFRAKELRLNQIEGEFTAPRDNLFPLYDTAKYHCQFPGAQKNPSADEDVAGLRKDPYFLDYCASRVPVYNTQEERIAYGAEAVASILDLIGEPTIIIAEGLGGVSGLLAADRNPDKVAGLILMGYPYAPFAIPFQHLKFDNGVAKLFHKDTMEQFAGLSDGLTPTALHYDPPLGPMQNLQVVKTYTGADKTSEYSFLQDTDKRVRKLVNLAKVPHLIVTPEAGSNSAYDWSIVAFLRQAGVAAEWYQLARFGLLGNGQLMWMEDNSSAIASLLQAWVVDKTSTDAADRARAAATLAVRQDQVALASARADLVRGTTASEATRYRAAMEERRGCWARREIAPLVQANADAMECFYSWLPVMDEARADFRAGQVAAAAHAAVAAAGGSRRGGRRAGRRAGRK